MPAILKIYGDIGDTGEMDGSISASMVSDFLDENKSAKEITVKINSRGGDVQEGWAIYDLLTTSGKKIKTIGEGKVYSIATIIFLAGTEREFMKNADGLIHNPFIPEYTLADKYGAADLEAIAESLRQEEAKILDFYVKKTGTEESKLADYMKEDTKLSAEDMLSLGFATKVIEPVMAFAYMKPSKFNKMTPNEEKTFMAKVEAAVSKTITALGLSRVDPINQTLKDKDGKEFTLDKESGAPAVGDKATPDGTFVMENGNTITIASGEVSKVEEPAAEDKSELEVANAKIAELQALVDAGAEDKVAADAVVAEAETAKETAEAVTVEAKALVTELTGLKNSWKPEARSKDKKVAGRIDLSVVAERRVKRIDNETTKKR